MTKPDDVTQEAWNEAHGIVSGLVSMHEYAGRPAWDEPIARAIMSAEKRGEERERKAIEEWSRDQSVKMDKVSKSYYSTDPYGLNSSRALHLATTYRIVADYISKRGEPK